MSLYILEDKNIHPFVNKRTIQEVIAVKALNQKRIPTKSITDASDLSVLLSDPKSVFLIPYAIESNTLSTLSTLKFCNSNNIPVIAMHNIPDFAPEYIYSSMGSNNWVLFVRIISYFLKYNKNRIAFFGMNPNSKSDRTKARHLYNIYSGFSSEDIFYLQNSFDNCFQNFTKKQYEYDAIICPNDFIAVALMNRIAEIDYNYIKSRFFIGFMDTHISKLYHTSLTSVTYDLKAVISAISSIYRTINHNRNIFNSINIQLPNTITVRDSTQNAPLPVGHTYFPYLSSTRPPLVLPKTDNFKYENDPELNIIMQIENMFENMSRLDFRIVYEILLGSTNHTICENLFISQQTLQYHTSHIFQLINAKNKTDFIKSISPYVCADKLKNYQPIYNSKS